MTSAAEEPARLARRLAMEGEKTLAFFHELDAGSWSQQVYSTGSGWSVLQVLAHFVSAERALALLVENVLAGGTGAPEDFEIDEFNEAEVARLGGEPIRSLRDSFQHARQRTLRLVEGMAPGDLELRGRHPWFGEAPLANIIKLIYRHNMIHLRDVRKALESGGPVPHLEITPPSSKGRDQGEHSQ